MRKEIGGFAVSAAGHDKGKLYVILSWEAGRFLLADGKIKTVENPKKKKEKHLELLPEKDANLMELLKDQRPVRNEDVKRAIKLYQASFSTK